jgi:hypothetical protein
MTEATFEVQVPPLEVESDDQSRIRFSSAWVGRLVSGTIEPRTMNGREGWVLTYRKVGRNGTETAENWYHTTVAEVTQHVAGLLGWLMEGPGLKATLLRPGPLESDG